VTFQLKQMEMDGIARGAKDADLEPLEEAARRIARFEESAVYNGFEPGGIEGIIPKSEHKPVALPGDARKFPEAVSHAVQTLVLAGIPGPFALVLGTEAWEGLMQCGAGGYPPQRIVRDLTDGNIRMSPAIDGGLLISVAAGNFELSVGQDFSIGYFGQECGDRAGGDDIGHQPSPPEVWPDGPQPDSQGPGSEEQEQEEPQGRRPGPPAEPADGKRHGRKQRQEEDE